MSSLWVYWIKLKPGTNFAQLSRIKFYPIWLKLCTAQQNNYVRAFQKVLKILLWLKMKYVVWHTTISVCTLGLVVYFRGFNKFSIKVAWNLQFLGYLRTISLKFQKARSKIEPLNIHRYMTRGAVLDKTCKTEVIGPSINDVNHFSGF